MTKSEFVVRMDGPVSIVEVRGCVDEAAAASLLEFAAAAATACRMVEIDLGGVESMTQEAASILLFRDAPWNAPAGAITLRADGRPGRQAVLSAYARRRARSQTA